MIAVAQRNDHEVILVQVDPSRARLWHRRRDRIFAPMELRLLEHDARWQAIDPALGRDLVGELERGIRGGLIVDDATPVHPWTLEPIR